MLLAEFLRLKQPRSLVFLAGEEEYFKRRGVDHLRACLPGAPVIGFGGPEERALAWPAINDEWHSRDLVGGGKLIVVTAEEARTFPPLAEPLRPAAATYRGKNHLVFLVARKESLKAGTPSWDSLATVVECRKLYDRVPPWKRAGSPWESELTAWLREEAGSRGKKLSWENAWFLAEHAGTDLGSLARELDKLSLLAGERPEITREEIAALASSQASPPAFRILEAAGMRRYGEARKYTREWLIGPGRSPLGLLSQLFSHYTRLWKGVVIQQEGPSRERVSQVCGVAPFLLDPFLSQIACQRDTAFLPVWEILAEADRRLKSSAGTPEEIYEQLFLALEQQRREHGTPGTSGTPRPVAPAL